MEFEVFRCRREGAVLPRHVMRSTEVRCDLYISEAYSKDLRRHVRVAHVRKHGATPVQALHNVLLIAAKPDWWTKTGWECIDEGVTALPRANQQRWILISADKAWGAVQT